MQQSCACGTAIPLRLGLGVLEGEMGSVVQEYQHT